MKVQTLVTAGLAAAFGSFAAAQTVSSALFTSTLRRPVFVTNAPYDATRMFIVEKQGFIRIHKNGVLQPTATPFLNIDSIVGGGTSNGDETGLLGLAFHPNYAWNGRFYVYYRTNSSSTAIAEFTRNPANPDLAVPSSFRTIMTINRNATNHQGGWMDFGDDGYLYLGSGDSGGGCDPDNAAQSVNDTRGKIIRIDIDGDDYPSDAAKNYRIPPTNPFASGGGAPEIFAMGIRNPWRNSFDRETGDLYIGDVGQGTREEITVLLASSPIAPVRNLGWDWKEGELTGTCGGTSGISTGVLTDPVHWYDHGVGCSLTGGYVYRGCAIPALQGTYFFGDYCTANIWSFRYTPGTGKTNFTDRTVQLGGANVKISNISSFGEDFFGEVYIIEQGGGTNGEIWKIIPSTGAVSCNPCPTDMNGDREVDDTDFAFFAQSYDILDCADLTMPPSCRADVNADGMVDDADFSLFAAAYDALLCN
jgi:glucose/arabinose dehydrogenase